MKEIGNMQGPAFRCRYRRIVVLASVVLARFYCMFILFVLVLLYEGINEIKSLTINVP